MKRYLFSILFLLAFTMLPTLVFAQNNPATGGVNNPALGGVNNPISGGAVSGGATEYKVVNPIGANSFCGLVKMLLQAAINIGIPIAVLFIVYAGFKFVLARGNAAKLEEARKNLLWTLVGIGIFLGAWLIAIVIANTVNALGGQQSIISCK